MRRRTFLETGATLAAAGALAGCARVPEPGPWRSFTDSEARIVDAVCEVLIPADRDPGARSASVVRYIDIQLGRAFRKLRPVYRQGLAQVDSTSRAKFAKAFEELSAPQQTEVLRVIEKTSRPFFELILAHAQQGFYGDPRHGGNRRRASWKMVGLDDPPLRGRQHYEGS